MKLSDIATFVEDKISSNSISLADYVTTDSLLPNKEGKTFATNLPPVVCSLTHYREGDVLVANIRPYLKKVWLANKEGGASTDVLVLRVKESNKSSFLYAVLLQDRFFEYAMKGAKGSKMPRGDKEQIMRYELPTFSPQEQENIGNIIISITKKMQLNRSLNHNLEAMAKQLYDYWFVQFDFPDENGKPYKSSGSKMVWNEKFKRDIPDGWEVAPLNRELEIKSGYAFKSGSYSSEGMFKIITIKNVQDGYLNISTCECIETLPKDIKKWCILQKGDRLISLTGNCGRVCRVTSEDLLLNQRVGVFCCDGLFSEYFYQFLASDEGNHYCVNLANGAAQANLSPIDLCKMELVYPSRETLSLFNKTVKPIIQQYIANEQKIENFTKLRNDLLPLLMNGQVSVNYDLSAFSSVFSQTILSIARLVVAI